jgi:hypothetical protein
MKFLGQVFPDEAISHPPAFLQCEISEAGDSAPGEPLMRMEEC